jgi:putative ABC transport system permease protein
MGNRTGMASRTYLVRFVRDMRSQKLRTFLTLFGIVWGTVAVTLLLAFGQGLHEQLIKTMRGLGENIVIAWPSRTSEPWQGLPRGRRIVVTDEDLAQVRRDVPLLTRLSGEYASWDLRFKQGRNVIVPGVSGTNAEYAEMRNMIAREGGRFIDARDLDRRRRVVFLGDKLAADLFGIDGAVGRDVSIGGMPFLVIGVMQTKEQDSSYCNRDNDRATMPASTFKAIHGRKAVDDFVFQVARREDGKLAKKDVVASLARLHSFDPSDVEAVSMWDTTENLDFLDTFMVGFRLFLGIAGALTLVVGGIGVSNVMHVVVEERTKEIGVKMALGARRRYVVGQFMFETLALTFPGGAIGFVIAFTICRLFPSSLVTYIGAPRISLGVAAPTSAVLGLIGVGAGFFPARAAASLDPVEALRL